MLIKCPECKKEVSDQSDQCIHCGFPLKKMNIQKENICIIGDKEYDLLPILQYIKSNESIRAIKELRKIAGIGLKDAKDICDIIKTTGKIPPNYKCEQSVPILQVSNQPRCPFCNSTDIRKISGTERAVSIIGLGLFSQKINKSFKCNNCGGTF